MKDLEFFDTHLEMNIQKSKTDIYRRGNTVVIAKTGNTLCPVSFLLRYILNLVNIYSLLFSSVKVLNRTNYVIDLNLYPIPELGKSFWIHWVSWVIINPSFVCIV